MKKKIIIAGVACFAVFAGVTVLAWKVFTVTNPYLIRPVTSSAAPNGASVGHSLNSGSRILSIVSSRDVVVVADPGASFNHEVVWLVEQPRKDGTQTLKEFRCDMPDHATLDQIKPLGSPVPTEIQQVADSGRW
jgi:hypothetical protein